MHSCHNTWTLNLYKSNGFYSFSLQSHCIVQTRFLSRNHKVFICLFFFSSRMQWRCFGSSVSPSRRVFRSQSWPCCSESASCGGPERLTLTPNPLALTAGLAMLNKSTGLFAQKSNSVQVSSGPVLRSPAVGGSGWQPPHYPTHSWDKSAWHPQRQPFHWPVTTGNFYFLTVNACKIPNSIGSLLISWTVIFLC